MPCHAEVAAARIERLSGVFQDCASSNEPEKLALSSLWAFSASTSKAIHNDPCIQGDSKKMESGVPLLHFWRLTTRLGEAQILLPAALFAALTLSARPASRPFVYRWVALLSAGVVVTIASKVAFIGWGTGWAAVNFTGMSGHAMLSTAVYPVLLGTFASSGAGTRRNVAIGAGCLLGILICVSRLLLGAHSLAEVLAGGLVGALITGLLFSNNHQPFEAVTPVILILLVTWLALMSAFAPSSRTFSAVTELSLYISGQERPYTRSRMMRDFRRQQSR